MAVLKNIITALAIVSCVTAFLPQPVRRPGYSSIVCHGKRGVARSTEPKPLSKRAIVRKIKRATKESFATDVYSPEIEAWMQAAGTTMHKKMRTKIVSRAKELEVEVNKKFGLKPYTGPPFWLKIEAAKALKAAVDKRDLAALEAAVEGAETLEGIEFVKEGQESEILNEAKALIDTVKAEVEAAEAAAAAAAAPEEPAEEATEEPAE